MNTLVDTEGRAWNWGLVKYTAYEKWWVKDVSSEMGYIAGPRGYLRRIEAAALDVSRGNSSA